MSSGKFKVLPFCKTSSMETIFAPICPVGGSVVSVRFSGDGAFNVLDVFSVSKDVYSKKDLFFTKLFYNGRLFDEVVVKIFRAPHSFTGENVVEIDLHGSAILLREFLKICSSIEGFRFAKNGEFSRRAFLNGKTDLMKCEGINALIKAETRTQYLLANTIFSGSLLEKYKTIRENLIKILTFVEVNIDFSDEEIPHDLGNEVQAVINGLKLEIQSVLDDKSVVDKITNGFSIAIIGPTNVGKSSLINLIAKRDIAIVSSIAGTTRDVLSVDVDFNGYKATFYDTAGLRESDDLIERNGIERAKTLAKDADLCLLMFDDVDDFKSKKSHFDAMYRNIIYVINKSDLREKSVLKEKYAGDNVVEISALNRYNVDILMAKIEDNLVCNVDKRSSPMFINERQAILLNECLRILETIDFDDMPIEIIGEDLRFACNKISEIIGDIYTDDILDSIFSNFCIGK